MSVTCISAVLIFWDIIGQRAVKVFMFVQIYKYTETKFYTTHDNVLEMAKLKSSAIKLEHLKTQKCRTSWNLSCTLKDIEHMLLQDSALIENSKVKCIIEPLHVLFKVESFTFIWVNMIFYKKGDTLL